MFSKSSRTLNELSTSDLLKLYEFITGPETEVPASPCCECGKVLELCAGKKNTPSPGDLSICFDCGGLNVFGQDLRLRKPTDEETFAAAADSEFQTLRRSAAWVVAQRKRGKSEGGV